MRRPPLHKGGGETRGVLGVFSTIPFFSSPARGEALESRETAAEIFFPGVDSQLVFFSCKFFSTNKISQLGDASGLFPTGARD